MKSSLLKEVRYYLPDEDAILEELNTAFTDSAFQTWLKEMFTAEDVGESNSSDSCPLATYVKDEVLEAGLSEAGFPEVYITVNVEDDQVTVNYYDEYVIFDLPEEFQRFYRYVDELGLDSVSGKDAAKIWYLAAEGCPDEVFDVEGYDEDALTNCDTCGGYHQTIQWRFDHLDMDESTLINTLTSTSTTTPTT